MTCLCRLNNVALLLGTFSLVVSLDPLQSELVEDDATLLQRTTQLAHQKSVQRESVKHNSTGNGTIEMNVSGELGPDFKLINMSENTQEVLNETLMQKENRNNGKHRESIPTEVGVCTVVMVAIFVVVAYTSWGGSYQSRG
eukprot:gnl/TRDRNA2_/TRDRNA2_68178_c0_seq1.p1 gnl/TRDRNA2_/TRDRNA2_68178_c0~~gnl/TRDRNA2_/TRDRNA2_68178_c0_seq1.p1  ORF type:complete len:141 (-),score=19.43 gnl/TRDRNA2_/TRDRNA2_68178_c0_seq1:404-826(-)